MQTRRRSFGHVWLLVTVAFVTVLSDPALAQAPPEPRTDRARASVAELERVIGTERFRGLLVETPLGLKSLTDSAITDFDSGMVLVEKISHAPKWDRDGQDLICVLPIRFGITGAAMGIPALELFILLEGGAIEYRPEKRMYTGTVRVGIRDESGTYQSTDLAGSAGIKLRFLASPGTVKPDKLVLTEVGLSDARLRFEASAIPGDAVRFNTYPEYGTPVDTDAVDLEVRRPRVTIDASPSTIQGLGVETSTITVALPVALAKLVGKVRLSTSRGTLEPRDVVLDETTGTGESELRSGGTGSAVVKVVSQDLQSDVHEIDFVLPWAFGLAAILGGVCGGLVHRLRSPNRGLTARSVPGAALRGILVGVVVAAAGTLGANLFEFDIGRVANEAAVFVAAALGCHFGPLKIGGIKPASAASPPGTVGTQPPQAPEATRET